MHKLPRWFVRVKQMSEKNLWGGRFEGNADPQFAEFNSSFRFDRRLFDADVRASIAWCEALERAGVVSSAEASQIKSGLGSIQAQGAPTGSSAEDVHSFVEARLIELVGDLGRKLHTGRSRNDQVATDLRLWLRDQIDSLQTHLAEAQRALIDVAETNPEIILP